MHTGSLISTIALTRFYKSSSFGKSLLLSWDVYRTYVVSFSFEYITYVYLPNFSMDLAFLREWFLWQLGGSRPLGYTTAYHKPTGLYMEGLYGTMGGQYIQNGLSMNMVGLYTGGRVYIRRITVPLLSLSVARCCQGLGLWVGFTVGNDIIN
jgi:hypothetical protein